MILLLAVMVGSGNAGSRNPSAEQDWAIGISLRTATIPYGAQTEKRIYSIIPLIFYQGNHLFFRGIAGGLHLYKKPSWQLNVVGRIHFVDLPNEYQNKVQPTNLDWGLQYRRYLKDPFFWEGEILTDMNQNLSGNLRLGMEWDRETYLISPYFEVKIKGRDYNSHYFGLTLEPIAGGLDYSLGILASAHIWSNFHVLGLARITMLDKNARAARYVQDDFTGEVLVGFGFANDPTRPRKAALHNRPYLRVAHGWATRSDFWSTVFFQLQPDTYHNQLTSLFYGHPLTDAVLGVPLDVYLTSGFVWHWPSTVQSDAAEIVLALKVYLNIPWPIRWRIGAAEGFSYLNHITYIERTGFEQKGYEPVKFLNYLDWSYDFNVGDILGKSLEQLWFGYSVHHRSGIYEAAQHFGRVNGGSNYYSFYLQWDL